MPSQSASGPRPVRSSEPTICLPSAFESFQTYLTSLVKTVDYHRYFVQRNNPIFGTQNMLNFVTMFLKAPPNQRLSKNLRSPSKSPPPRSPQLWPDDLVEQVQAVRTALPALDGRRALRRRAAGTRAGGVGDSGGIGADGDGGGTGEPIRGCAVIGMVLQSSLNQTNTGGD